MTFDSQQGYGQTHGSHPQIPIRKKRINIRGEKRKEGEGRGGMGEGGGGEGMGEGRGGEGGVHGAREGERRVGGKEGGGEEAECTNPGDNIQH